MKIIFMGTPDFAVPVLEALIRAGHDICCVLTQPDRRRSRGKITFSPVKQCALDHGLTVYQPDKLKDDTDVKNALAVCRADAAVVVAYGQILKKDVLDMPRLGCFNVHASLLPKYRGAAPMQAAILNGEEETGVTIMKMGVGLDNGDMAAQARTSVGRKNFEQIHDELSAMGAQLLVDTLPLIERGEVVFVKQDDSEATYAPKLTKQDGRIDFGKSPKQIDQQVRAFDPWPGAFCDYSGKTLKVWKTECPEGSSDASGGTVLNTGKEGITVACGGGLLRITELQMPGKKRTRAADFLLGHNVETGTVLR